MKIEINEFVLRQTKDSRFSYFAGEFWDVALLAAENFEKGKQGYKDGVWLVPVPCEGFFSGVAEVTGKTILAAKFEARRKGEHPFLFVEAVGEEKLPAKYVELVLYRHDVLAENSENSTDAEWELVSINARATEEEEPLTPITMARNFLGMAGGSKAVYTAEEFAKAIVYWSKRAMCG